MSEKVFISYAWGGESEKLVDELYSVLENVGFNIIRDKINLGYKGNIKEFMQEIGSGSAIVVVISDKYLRSPNCMYEIVQIQENQNLMERIFPIVLEDAQIYKPAERLVYVKHWEDEVKSLNKSMKGIENMAIISEIQQELAEYNQILNAISGIATLLKNTNTLTPDILQKNEYKPLVEQLENRIKTEITKEKPEKKMDKENLRNLIAKNSYKAVFNSLKNSQLSEQQQDMLSMIEGEYNQLQNNTMMGLISNAEINLQSNQIRYKLLNLIGQL